MYSYLLCEKYSFRLIFTVHMVSIAIVIATEYHFSHESSTFRIKYLSYRSQTVRGDAH